MLARHVATISSDGSKDIKRSLVANDMPMYTQYARVQSVDLHKGSDLHIKDEAKDYFGEGVFLGDNVMSLQQMYKDDVLPSEDVLREASLKMFPNELDRDAFYTPFAGLSVLSGTLVVQGGNLFNPDGYISLADFLDGLNATSFGANANSKRKRSLDKISVEADFFNEGYNSCMDGVSSPFFNLYTRPELMKPVTRLELAYITVSCWKLFRNKFNTLYGGDYYLGITFDWEAPKNALSNFDDGFDYQVVSYTSNDDIISLDLKDYKGEYTVSDYLDAIHRGELAIPLPMFMSLVELANIGVFVFDGRLDPMKEVSRGEFAYFISKITERLV